MLNQIKFKTIQHDQDEYVILATQNFETIAKLNLDIMVSMYDYFEGDFTEEEYDQLFPNDECVFVSWLEVYNDAFKGNGIGKQLMNLAIQKTQQLGYDTMYLNASPIKSNKSLDLNSLVNFYKSFGFKEIKHQGHNVQMLLNLDGQLNETKSLIKNLLRQKL